MVCREWSNLRDPCRWVTRVSIVEEVPIWTSAPGGAHGEVFTRRWVVELILDLVGYDADADLGNATIVEPSCGQGAFMLPIVERLMDSCVRYGHALSDMGGAIRGFDLLAHNVEHTRKTVMAKLLESGVFMGTAKRLSKEWVTTGDFLLTDHSHEVADFVVGNPPYIRLEDVSAEVSDAYRAECSTMRGRADVFVGFFEKGLSLLAPGGRLAFICPDRWMRNQYGARLRRLVGESYAVDSVLVMHEVDAFEDEVSAYPAIVVLRNGSQGTARVVEAQTNFDKAASARLMPWLIGDRLELPVDNSFEAAEVAGWFEGTEYWPSGSLASLEVLAELEERFGPLEDSSTGTRVGIGVASGCDDVFVVTGALGIEDSRLLPLLTASDIATGKPVWSGRYLVNPWADGRLVGLADFPGLSTYLESHGERVRSRYVARKRPSAWYRTVDRVDPSLQARPKLLLPDMKAATHPVLDTGEFYPHHNLYYIVSDGWDLEVLGGLLLSDVANLFVGAYCVKMRGGTYRFQAQYLRKIRVPDPTTLSSRQEAALAEAFRVRDRIRATAVAAEVYALDESRLGGLWGC